MTTLVARSRTYQFEVVPFEHINALATFQRLMDKILHCILFCRAYLDDVVVFSKSADKYLEHLENIFLLLGRHNLKLKVLKCKFAKSSVELLSHVVGSKGISDDSEKLASCGELLSFKMLRT